MIVILSYKGVEDTPYHEWIPELINEVYLFCNSQTVDTYPDEIYKNKYSYNNYNENENLELDIIKLNQEKPIEAIIALDEFDVGRAGRLRDYLGIDGQSLISSKQFRDKLFMKKCLSQHGVSVTPFAKAETVFDVLRFIEKHGYPVVLKPRQMAGSIGVNIIESENSLKEFIEDGIPKDYLIEKYVDGPMYHVDGIITDNKVNVIFPSKYRSDCIEWSKGGFTASFMLEKTNPLFKQLCDFVDKSISKLELPKVSPFHAEVFVTNEGLIFNEVGSRVPGGRSNYEFFYGTGLNFNSIAVRSQCGLSVPDINLNYKITGHIYIPPKEGKLLNLPDSLPYEYVKEYIPYVNLIGEDFSGAQDSVDCIATVICTGESETDIIQNIDNIYKYFDGEVRWE